MCSVFDFIDKQNYLIQNKRKTIQTLYKFLDSIDKNEKNTESNGLKKESSQSKQESNGVSNGNYVSNQKIENKNKSMIETNGLLGWIDSNKSQQRRQQLAEERRREYNEFLEKLKPDSRNSSRNSKRVTKLIPDYNDLLNDKRMEERKHRQTNGLDSDYIENLTEMTSYKESGKPFSGVSTIGSFYCSNNKFVPEYITPRSRLLATHSSRLKAAKYREELRKQVEEKERLKAEEEKRIRLEEEELEHKLEEQRLKLLEEFEEEQRLLKQKAEQRLTEDEKQILNRDLMIGSTSPLSLLRSPTYLHMKQTKALNPVPRKASAVSRSLASVLSDVMLPNTQSMATQTNDEPKHITSDEFSDCDTVSSEENSEEEEEEVEDITKEAEFRRRVLSQLSDVRQMMESDHIKMMEQLRHQQLSQLDE